MAPSDGTDSARTSTDSVSVRPAQSRLSTARVAAANRAAIPLGSLTQRQSSIGAVCVECSSPRITQLAMNLTDGTPVDFTSCHVCAHKSWSHGGVELAVSDVLDRTRKVS